MATFAFVLPILPGKEATDRQGFERFNGEDKEAYSAARRSQGLTRETIWHQPTPNGTLAIIVYEGEDIPAALAKIGSSDAPFDVAFRAFIQDVHGFTPGDGPPPEVRLISDMKF